MSAGAWGGHWEEVYRSKPAARTSWHRAHLDESLRLIDALALPQGAAILDVGGGRSHLVDDLLARGFTNLGVLDIAGAALDAARLRLGAAADRVQWLHGDLTEMELPRAGYALWHDRAVFHFLTDAPQRARYAAQMRHAIAAGGHALVATFANDGPERCSGLPVQRYDAPALAAQFAPAFECIEASRELHRTPWGSEQPFTYVVLRRTEPTAACAARSADR